MQVKPEVGTEEATLHCCEDWSVDALARRPNKYCTYNLAPNCGPYSLAPRLTSGRPRGTRNATHYVSCIYRAHMTTGLVRWMSQAAFQRDMFCSIWQSVQTSTDLQNTHFDWPHHKWAVHGSNPAKLRELYSTWRWVQAAATSIQPHNFFFFLQRNAHTRDAHMLGELCVETSKQTEKIPHVLPDKETFFTE